MSKKYYAWIILGVFIIIAGAFLVSNRSKAPSVSPVSVPVQDKISGDTAPVKIDLENDADFEQDIDDLDVSEEILDDFDSEDFDADTIDNNIF